MTPEVPLRWLLYFALFSISPSLFATPKCVQAFSHKKADRLSDLIEEYQQRSLEVFRKSVTGRWVQLENGTYVRFQLFGKKGPLRIHFEGLGGQIETSMQSHILSAHAKRGRVLVIELEGQGAREVHRRLELIAEGKDPLRDIPYDQNIKMLAEAARMIAKAEGLPIGPRTIFGGHSYGGLSSSGFLIALAMESGPLLQFIATGVANFNHHFMNKGENQSVSIIANFVSVQHSMMKTITDAHKNWSDFLTLPGFRTDLQKTPSASALAIQTGMEALGDPALFGHLAKDPVKMESAVALTIGAREKDITNDPKKYPQGTRVQIISGENDSIVFAMLHWELGMASRQAGHKTTMVMVEGTGHYLPKELTKSQQKAIDDLSRRPSEFDGYYYLTRRGKFKRLTEEQALKIYEKSSWKTWEAQEETLRQIFSKLGKIIEYPWARP